MGFIGKAIHLQSEFGNNNGTHTHIDPGHFIQDVDGLRAAQPLRGVGLSTRG